MWDKVRITLYENRRYVNAEDCETWLKYRDTCVLIKINTTPVFELDITALCEDIEDYFVKNACKLISCEINYRAKYILCRYAKGIYVNDVAFNFKILKRETLDTLLALTKNGEDNLPTKLIDNLFSIDEELECTVFQGV